MDNCYAQLTRKKLKHIAFYFNSLLNNANECRAIWSVIVEKIMLIQRMSVETRRY